MPYYCPTCSTEGRTAPPRIPCEHHPLTIRRAVKPKRADEVDDCAVFDRDSNIIAECFSRVGETDFRDAYRLALLFQAAPKLLGFARKIGERPFEAHPLISGEVVRGMITEARALYALATGFSINGVPIDAPSEFAFDDPTKGLEKS